MWNAPRFYDTPNHFFYDDDDDDSSKSFITRRPGLNPVDVVGHSSFNDFAADDAGDAFAVILATVCSTLPCQVCYNLELVTFACRA